MRPVSPLYLSVFFFRMQNQSHAKKAMMQQTTKTAIVFQGVR